jgi:hypothetical protein
MWSSGQCRIHTSNSKHHCLMEQCASIPQLRLESNIYEIFYFWVLPPLNSMLSGPSILLGAPVEQVRFQSLSYLLSDQSA